MEIIIGRDPNTNHLAVLVDGKRGVDSSVTFPQSISRLRLMKIWGIAVY